MSAITGIFMRNGKNVDPELMKKMNDKLAHRGPDGSSVWCEGSVGLGHQMLWTTPESLHEVLPLEEDGLVITADARIDNREELSEELDIPDEEDVSDSYFILKAYAKWGDDCPDKLLGDFAFAIWDKNKEKLFCARDHMGVKPFYYYLDEDMFVFGTEIKALFEVHGVPKALDELKIAFHLTNTPDKKFTFYEKILRLSAANNIIISRDEDNKKKYWVLDLEYDLKLNSESDYINEFKKIFQKAVKCRLRTHYKLGFELSGGLDSTSVISTAKEISNSKIFPLDSFSTIFPDIPQSNEKLYIDKIIDLNNINPFFIIGDNLSPFNKIKDIFWYLDQPFSNPHSTIIWNLLNEMKKNNIRVLLTGLGGDGVISNGPQYFKYLALKFKFISLIKEINSKSINSGVNRIKIAYEEVLIPIASQILNLVHLNNLRRKSICRKFNKEFQKRISIKYPEKIINNGFVGSNPKKNQYFFLETVSHQSLLEFEDSSVGAFSMESRHPFLDKRLVEFCFSIPSEMKFKNGWNKYILRKCMDGILPDEINWNPKKMRWGPVFFRNIEIDKEIIEESLNDSDISYYIQKDHLKKMKKNFHNGNRKNLFELWLISILSLWLKF